MQNPDETSVESTPTEQKDEWLKPEVVSVAPITHARGLGGAGFDFASEIS